VAKKKQKRGTGPASVPFEQQIANYSVDRLRQTRILLEEQKRAHYQRWSTMHHSDQTRIGLHQLNDLDRKLSLIAGRLAVLEPAEQETDATPADEGGPVASPS